MSPHLGHRIRFPHLFFTLLICLGQSALINNAPDNSDISSIIMQTNFGRNAGYGSGYLGGSTSEKPLVVYGGVVPRSDSQWGGNLQTTANAYPQYAPRAPISNIESLNNLNKLLEERRNILSQYLTLADLAKSDFYLPENSSTKKNDNQKTVNQQITSGFLFLPLQEYQPETLQNSYAVQTQVRPSDPSEPIIYIPPVKDQPRLPAAVEEKNKLMSEDEVSELQSNLLTLKKDMQEKQTNQLFNRFTNEFNDRGASAPPTTTIISPEIVQPIYKHDPFTSAPPAPKPVYQPSNPQTYDTMVSSLRDSINNRFNNLFKP